MCTRHGRRWTTQCVAHAPPTPCTHLTTAVPCRSETVFSTTIVRENKAKKRPAIRSFGFSSSRAFKCFTTRPPTCRWWALGGEGKRSPIPKRDGMESFSPRATAVWSRTVWSQGSCLAVSNCDTVVPAALQRDGFSLTKTTRGDPTCRPAIRVCPAEKPQLVIYGVVTHTSIEQAIRDAASDAESLRTHTVRWDKRGRGEAQRHEQSFARGVGIGYNET